MALVTEFKPHLRIKQMKKIIPLITCEPTFCLYVCNLVFGVDVPNLNHRIQVDPAKQPVKGNSVGSGHVSQCRTPAYDCHLNHGFDVLENIQHSAGLRKSHIRRHTVNIAEIKIVVIG